MNRNRADSLGRSGRNLLLSLGSEAAVRLGGLAVLIILARYLGPSGFGVYNTLLAFYMLAVTLGNLGLDRLATRELSRDVASATVMFNTLLMLRLAAGVLTACVLAATGAVLKPESLTLFVVLGLALIPNAIAGTVVAAFQARHEFGPPSRATGTTAVAAFVATAAGVMANAPLAWFIFVICGSELLRCAWLVLAGRQVQLWRPERVSPDRARQALVHAFPYGSLVVIGALYLRIDLILLDALVGGAAVGHYASAFRILEAASALPFVILAVLFPRFVQLQQRDAAAARALYLAVLPLICWAGIGFAIAGATLARPLLTLLYSSSYAAAAPAMIWLMLAAVPLFLQLANTTVLLAGVQLRTVVIWSVVMLAFKIAAVTVLAPRFAASGAAMATAFAEIASLVVFTRLVCIRLSIAPRTCVSALLAPWRALRQIDLLLDRSVPFERAPAR